MTVLLQQSLRFAIVGLVNTAIGVAVIYTIMFFFQTGPVIANVIGYAIGIAISFALNRAWTFNNSRPIVHVLPKYFLVVVVCYTLNLGVVLAATSHFLINGYVAQLIGMAIYTTCMFFGCRLFVFGPPTSANGY